MVVLLRSTDGNPDSRLQKYVDVLVNKRIPFKVVCWDRKDIYSDNAEWVYYHKKALYGAGWRNVFNLFLFNSFILKYLFKNRKDITTIHACDFDTVLPGILMKIFWGKKLIYDIFDWYVDSREMGILRYFILPLECINLKLADRTIICEEERVEQLCCKPKDLWVLPNIPNLKFVSNKSYLSNPERIHLSYVGVFTSHRGLEKMLATVSKHPNIYWDIAGFGELEDLVRQAANSCENIHYHGSVSYEEGLEIMSQSDMILAIYETTIPNHIYAAPNKYYEGLFLGKPILTTKGTYVGEKTEKYETGYVVGETQEELFLFFSELSSEDLKKKGENARKLWVDTYANYVDDFMTDKYLPFVACVK